MPPVQRNTVLCAFEKYSQTSWPFLPVKVKVGLLCSTNREATVIQKPWLQRWEIHLWTQDIHGQWGFTLEPLSLYLAQKCSKKMKRKNVCDSYRETAFQKSRMSEIQRREDVSQSFRVGWGRGYQGKERTKFQRNMSCPRDSKASLLWEKASLKIMGVLQSSVERQWEIEQGINDLWTRLILRLCTRLMTFSTSFQITSLQLLKFGQGSEDWPVNLVSPCRASTVHLARKDRWLPFPFSNNHAF